MGEEYIITELDEVGHRRKIVVNNRHSKILDDSLVRRTSGGHLIVFLKKVFLPARFPDSVSPDYLRYQVLNALQAFCSSLASLLSSRAVLEGFGVGDPSATATYAMLMTVVQDVCNRLITICGAYVYGSSLVPEAKTYRFLADILNDAGIILDTLSPVLGSPNFIFPLPGLRIGALCLSASFKALCGIFAGGSKAAITLHFATPIIGSGDVGDLNAKDSSKETTLALLGMLLGTLIVPHLATPGLTYSAMLILVALHLSINFFAVRGLELRSLNRQRTGIMWAAYRSTNSNEIPSPKQVSKVESFLGHPDAFRDDRGKIIGRCDIGSAFFDIFPNRLPVLLLKIFEQERYILWYDDQSLYQISGSDGQLVRRGPVKLHILFKEGFVENDQLKAWCHAAEICRLLASNSTKEHLEDNAYDALSIINTTLRSCSRDFAHFVGGLRGALWNLEHINLMVGSPKAVLADIELRGNDYKGSKRLY